jgi:predicted DNA-binding transcriptional regulator AlpA
VTSDSTRLAGLAEALEHVRSHTNLTEEEWSALCATVYKRANALVPSTTAPISEAPAQSLKGQKLSSWVTQRDLARILSVKEDTMYKWRERGKLPPGEQVGNRTVWSRKVVRAWLSDLEVLATASG